MKSKLQAMMTIVAFSFLAAGCGGRGGHDGSAGDNRPREVIQSANATSNLLGAIKEEAIKNFMNAVTHGAATFPGGAGAPSPLVVHNINLLALDDEPIDTDYEVDFDQPNEQGQDSFPKLSGRIRVHVVQNTYNPNEGEASYTVTVWILEPVTYKDQTGVEVTLADTNGVDEEDLSVQAGLEWDIENDGSYTLDVTSSIVVNGLAITGTHPQKGSFEVHISGKADAAVRVAVDASAVATVTCDISADFVIHLTMNGQEYTIHLLVDDLTVTITVNGATFGPYDFEKALNELGIPIEC